MNSKRHARLRRQQAIRKFLRSIRRDLYDRLTAEIANNAICYDAEGYERVKRIAEVVIHEAAARSTFIKKFEPMKSRAVVIDYVQDDNAMYERCFTIRNEP